MTVGGTLSLCLRSCLSSTKVDGEFSSRVAVEANSRTQTHRQNFNAVVVFPLRVFWSKNCLIYNDNDHLE